MLRHDYLGFEIDPEMCKVAEKYIEADRQEWLPLTSSS